MNVLSDIATAKRQVRVRLFALARDVAGASVVELEVSVDADVGALRRELTTRYPQLAGFGSSLRFAIDNDYSDDETPLPEDAEIACIPPVSGG